MVSNILGDIFVVSPGPVAQGHAGDRGGNKFYDTFLFSVVTIIDQVIKTTI